MPCDTCRSDDHACPRELNPIIADAARDNPAIACTYVPEQVRLSCHGRAPAALH